MDRSTWTPALEAEACSQGWGLFHAGEGGLQIQFLQDSPDGPFGSDGEAWTFVIAESMMRGGEAACVALALLEAHNPHELDLIMDHAAGQGIFPAGGLTHSA